MKSIINLTIGIEIHCIVLTGPVDRLINKWLRGIIAIMSH